MTEPEVAALCTAHAAIGAALTREDGSLATFGALTGTPTSP